ncbi:MAG: tetratricopeptide repeat protein, partial [Burkholderiales bacterium]|nr:tetratricopeptide repeat protein [Anaerolineae bacterium]
MRPRDPLTQHARAFVYQYHGHLNEAIAVYNWLLTIDPRYENGYLNRGMAYLHKGDSAQALADVNAGLDVNPNLPNLYNGRGNVYFVQRDYALALADFQRAEELVSSEHSRAGIAVTLFALGQVEEAGQLWRELSAENAKYAEIDRVKKKLGWAEPLVEEGRRLIAGLNPQAVAQAMAGVTSVVSN